MPAQGRKSNPASGGVWGVLGGSFNPIHLGHLVMAETVMHSLEADGMLFVPTRNHPLKTGQEMASYADRLAMVHAAIRGNRRFCLEEPPEGAGYTIDLIDCLRSRYPATEFFLAVGSDIVEEFASWHKYDDLEHTVRIVIARRPGYQFPKRNGAVLRGAEQVIIPQYDISSSDIRQRVRAHLSIRYMVPERVLRIIETRRLYA